MIHFDIPAFSATQKIGNNNKPTITASNRKYIYYLKWIRFFDSGRQHTMDQTISKVLTELNFLDMEFQIDEQGPDCFCIRLYQKQDVEINIEILYEDGGIIGSVLEFKGMSHSTKSLIMDTLMKHLEFN